MNYMQALVFYAQGNRQKTVKWLNLLPDHKIPYGRMADFLRE